MREDEITNGWKIEWERRLRGTGRSSGSTVRHNRRKALISSGRVCVINKKHLH